MYLTTSTTLGGYQYTWQTGLVQRARKILHGVQNEAANSVMAIDQAHEQEDKRIKNMSNSCEQTRLKWSVSLKNDSFYPICRNSKKR